MREVWVGLDVGTQGARAVALTETGEVVGRGARPLASRRTPGRHEQDPDDWWAAGSAAIAEAVADLPENAVSGVAIDATSGTVLVADHQGRALTPALMYDDSRAGGDLLGRVNTVGGPLWERLGYQRMQAGWGLPKLLWLLEHHPEARHGRLQHQGDHLVARLVGSAAGREVATDLSSALKTGADQIDEVWPVDLLGELGLPASLFPELVRPSSSLGVVCRAAAAATGLRAGTPVLAGCTDGYASQVASGALEPGSWNVVLGTTMVFKGVTTALLHDPGGVVYSHKAPGGEWLPGGASSTGAGVVATDFDEARLDDLTAAAPDHEPAGSVTYPLAGEGERFPFVAPDARGFALGEPRDEAERFAAVLQGVAFVERLSLDVLDHLGAPLDGRHVSTGGGSANAYWTQLRADVTGRDLEVPDVAGSAAGAAVLAASSVGDLAGRARAMVPRGVVHRHDAERGARFLPAYRELVGALAERGWLDAGQAEHADRRAAS